MTGIPGSPPDLRHIPQGCAFHLRCRFVFDACRKQIPVLAAPAIRGVHIGEDQLEPDDESIDASTLKRTQQSLVACHLYDPDLVGRRMEDLLKAASSRSLANKLNGAGTESITGMGKG